MSFQDFRHFCYLDTLSHVVQVTRQAAEDIVSSLEPGKFSNVSRETFPCLSAPRLLCPRRHLNIILGILCSVEGGKKIISNYVQIFFLHFFLSVYYDSKYLELSQLRSWQLGFLFCFFLLLSSGGFMIHHIIILSLVQILSVFNRFI